MEIISPVIVFRSVSNLAKKNLIPDININPNAIPNPVKGVARSIP